MYFIPIMSSAFAAHGSGKQETNNAFDDLRTPVIWSYAAGAGGRLKVSPIPTGSTGTAGPLPPERTVACLAYGSCGAYSCYSFSKMRIHVSALVTSLRSERSITALETMPLIVFMQVARGRPHRLY
jgi:hypothetical protein